MNRKEGQERRIYVAPQLVLSYTKSPRSLLQNFSTLIEDGVDDAPDIIQNSGSGIGADPYFNQN